MLEQIVISKQVTGGGKDLLLCADASKPVQQLAERAGCAQVVYIDPPFLSNDTYARRRFYGEKGWRTGSPSIPLTGYQDRFESREAYLAMLRGLLENAWLLLGSSGVLALHLDWHASAYARVLCDEVFGEDRFINEIIWSYESGGRAKKYFSRKHDTILLYSRTKNYKFDLTRVPMLRSETRHNHLRRNVDEDGRAYRSIRVGGKEYRYYDDEPVYPGDVWTDISHLQQRDPERTGFLTQKPQKLLERLLLPLTEPGDLVCDLCAGSGTTLAQAQELGCRILGVELNPGNTAAMMTRLKTDNLMLDLPSDPSPAVLTSALAMEKRTLTLTGFDPRDERFPKTDDPLDAIENWSIGRLDGDMLRVTRSWARSRRYPGLTPTACLPQGVGTLAVCVTDAAGVRRAYKWVP